jgi:hypothetical protein
MASQALAAQNTSQGQSYANQQAAMQSATQHADRTAALQIEQKQKTNDIGMVNKGAQSVLDAASQTAHSAFKTS